MRSTQDMWTVCALALVLTPWGSFAQTSAQTGAQTPASVSPEAETSALNTVEDPLHAMTAQAAVIFAGQVTAVRRLDGSSSGATGVVEIDFAVDDAVRGVGSGTYTLREWAGLWNAGELPLRVGQRYLMLLHAPGASGLSSPVGGMDGAIPIHGGTTVDLRWVAARVVRPIAYRPAPVARPTARPVAAPAELDATTAASTTSPQQAAYATVLAMLRSWEKDDAAAR
jgi:hypothetical protein